MSGYASNSAYEPPNEQSNISAYNSYDEEGSYLDQSYNVDYNQAQTMAAFYQNANVPGFDTAAPSGSVPFPQAGTWQQQVNHSVGAFPPYDAAYANYQPEYNSFFNGNQTSSVPQQPQDSKMDRGQNDGEDGELSEGEFEDPTPGPAIQPTSHNLAHFQGGYQQKPTMLPRFSQTSAASEVSSKPKSSPVTDIYGRTVDSNRQRSPSYSPHISPILASRPIPKGPKKHNVRNRKPARQPVELQYDEGEISYETKPTPANDETMKALNEARKEAQRAILNLYPFKIRLEDFVAEGIDEAVVRMQLQELGTLPNPSSKNINNNQPNFIEQHDSQPLMTITNVGSTKTNLEQPQQQVTKDKGEVMVEERKDRIARLLAEKAKKASAESAAAAATKADKERLLRQKMEALQKSREARAQKASAAKPIPVPPASTPQAASEPISGGQPLSHSTTSQPTSDLSLSYSPSPVTSQEHNGSVPAQPKSVPSLPLSIPGLFLSAEGGSSLSSSTNMQSNNLRKRPVASDFDRPSPPKKPFGQNKQEEQSFVIDVSEDESDDGAALDDTGPGDVLQSYQTFQTKAHVHNGPSIRDHPPLSDFTPRKVLSPSVSGLSTPATPKANTKAAAAQPKVDVNAHAKELEELKKKLALMEARKKVKQSSTNTPLVAPPESSNPRVAAAATRIEHLMDVATKQVHQDQESLKNALVAGLQETQELQSNEAQQRRLRRLRIKEDLPLIEAEVEESRKKLAQLKEEMKQLEASVEEGLRNKLRLAEEMEKLQEEVDEQAPDDFQAAPTESSSLSGASPSSVPVAHNSVVATEPTYSNTQQNPSKDPGTTSDVEMATDVPNEEVETPITANTLPSLPIAANRSSPDHQTNLEILTVKSPEFQTDQSMDAALQNAIANADADADAESDSLVSTDEQMEDDSAPGSGDLAPISASIPLLNAEVAEASPHTRSASITSGQMSSASDEYEPQEDMKSPSSDEVPMSMDSPPFSPAPFETAESDEAASSPMADYLSAPNSVSDLAVHEAHVIPQEPVSLEGGDNTSEEAKEHYTPYESPLKLFRQFRFHPIFEQEVAGGFKSITYSNRINPHQELCRYELAGGVCNDNSCEFQHFRDMGLADDAILVQLGNSDGYNDADKPKFVAGLRGVLQDLRAKKVKDFKSIASEIAAYRSKFLQDNTKVLLLGDTDV